MSSDAPRWPCLLWLLCSASAGLAQPQPQPQAIRQAEMASCAPGELATWPDGRDRPAAVGAVRLVYQHQGAPARFGEATVLAALQRAATAWSACGVPGTVAEHTDKGLATNAGDVQVRWDDAATRGHFALADVGRRQLWLSAAMFSLLAQRNPQHPAQETLQMAIMRISAIVDAHFRLIVDGKTGLPWAAPGRRAGTGLNVAESSTISLK